MLGCPEEVMENHHITFSRGVTRSHLPFRYIIPPGSGKEKFMDMLRSGAGTQVRDGSGKRLEVSQLENASPNREGAIG